MPIDTLTGTHDHDFSRHPAEDRPVTPAPTRNRLEPKVGFDWTRVRWTGPYALVDETCSYCGAAIPDEDVPLRMWNVDSWAAVFCYGCMATWWGMEGLEDADDDYLDALSEDEHFTDGDD